MKITDRSLRALKPREERYLVRDTSTEMKGFAVRVSPNGTKTFLAIIQASGQRRWETLGTFPVISLAEAHELFARAKKRAAAKRRGEAPPDLTLEEFAKVYIERHAKRWKRSWAEDQRRLDKDILPVLGKARKAEEITRTEIHEILEKIGERAPVNSNRVRALLSKMFRFGMSRGLVTRNPVDGIQDLFRETSRDRWLTAEEIRTFWTGLDDTVSITPRVRTALRLILVTGQRPGEIAGMSWEEIDGEWWTIPPERSKTGIQHRVYLTDTARELLGDPGEGIVFLSKAKDGGPLRPRSLSQALMRLKYFGMEPFKPHDLRRTCASHMAAVGVAPHVVDEVIGHKNPSQRMLKIYQRYDYDAEKKRALTRWSRELGRILGWQEEDRKVVRMGE